VSKGRLYYVNNSVTFSGKPIGSEVEYLNQMVETLGIIIDRCPKGRPRKMEIQTIEKIGFAWVQVANATLNFGIICQKKGVAYGSLLSVKY